MKVRSSPLISWLSLVLAAAALGLAGCSSTATTKTASNPMSQPPPKVIDLQRGMTPDQVQALLGTPTEVNVAEPSAANIAVWIYRRHIGSRVDAVAPTMVSEPWIDPITSQLFYIESPEASERRVDFIEELTLYFASGQLTEANRTVKREYQFSH